MTQSQQELVIRMLEETYDFDQNTEIFTEVKVYDPVITKEGFRYVITYKIDLESNDPSFTFQQSSVKRRFSDFCVLRSLLGIQHPLIGPFQLPPKMLNPFLRPSAEFIETRRKGLEKFLKEVLRIPVYLSNKALHLFLQSMLPMSIIAPLVTGKSPRNEDLASCSVDGDSLKHLRENMRYFCETSKESLLCSYINGSVKQFSVAPTEVISIPPSSMRCAKDGNANKYVQLCVPTLHYPRSDSVVPRCSSSASMVDSQCNSVDGGVNSGSFPGAQLDAKMSCMSALELTTDSTAISYDRDSCTLDLISKDEQLHSDNSLLSLGVEVGVEALHVKAQDFHVAKDEGVADLL